MNWTEHQSAALMAVEKWFKSRNRKQIFRVFGYAGVGKTSLAKHFASSIKGTVLYAAYTGKAALMMRKNGCSGATTIHRLIYSATQDETGRLHFHLNPASPLKFASLLVVDECSMVDDKLAADILSFNVPVLVLGDPAQLPPINGTGYFTNAEPDVMLTEIHRQAKDNPIIYLATSVREHGILNVGKYGDSIVASDMESTDEFLTYDQIITGKNDTRRAINSHVRYMRGLEDIFPQVDDRVICLKNDHLMGILNGEMFTVTGRGLDSTNFKEYKVRQIDDNPRDFFVKVHNSFFDGSKEPDFRKLKNTQQFDYGYAITAHKSQGSQWNDVLIVDESFIAREDAKRWLYTAITRAQNKVLVYKT